MKGTNSQFVAIADLVKDSYGGWIEDVQESAFDGVLAVSVKHDDQRDGTWTEYYLIGQDGARLKISGASAVQGLFKR